MPCLKLANLRRRLILIRWYSGLCTERVRVKAVRSPTSKSYGPLTFRKTSVKLRFQVANELHSDNGMVIAKERTEQEG